MPGIMDLLGGIGNTAPGAAPDAQMTPEMIALLTELGKGKAAPAASQRILQPSGSNPYHAVHWSQGAADILNAISGNNMINRADQSRVGSRERVPTVVGPTQPNAPPNSGRLPPQAPIDPNPAQTMFGVRPGPIPPGFSEAPNGQGANTNVASAEPNNDPARMSLGVPPPSGERTITRARNGTPLTEITSPSGARFSVNADHADRFEGFLNDLHAAGYNVDGQQSGGFADRNIRGTNRPSQHSHGAAIDVNWTSNAEGTRGNIPPNVARELARKHGLIWGGDFRSRSPDPMHFEIDPNFTPNNDALPVVQAADRRAPQDNPPPPRDMANRPLGVTGLPILNPEVDFRATYPTPPPDDFGLTPRQSMDLDNLSDRAYKRKIESLQRQWEPQYTDAPGGRRWVVPATGQTGFIPTPKYDHVEANGAKVPVVTIYDAHGRSYTYEQAPSGEISTLPGTQTAAPAAAPNAAPAPVTPPVEPNAAPAPVTPPVAPPVAPNAPAAPNAPTLNNIPPLPNAPPAPNTPRKSWLDGPTFARARDIQIEQSERKVSADTRQSAREEPIKQAIEVGNEAQRTRAILDQLRELENHPGIQDLSTGPLGEQILTARTGINQILKGAGLSEWNPQMVAAGEQLRKLNTMLGSVGARQLTNRPTQFDFQAFLKANPGILASAQGRRFLTETLSQMAERDIAIGAAASAYRGRAEDWPRELDRIYLQHRPIVNGNVLDNTTSSGGRLDLNTGQIQYNNFVRGRIEGDSEGNSYQFIGRTGNNQDGKNPSLWVKVDPRNPSTFRIPEMETPSRK